MRMLPVLSLLFLVTCGIAQVVSRMQNLVDPDLFSLPELQELHVRPGLVAGHGLPSANPALARTQAGLKMHINWEERRWMSDLTLPIGEHARNRLPVQAGLSWHGGLVGLAVDYQQDGYRRLDLQRTTEQYPEGLGMVAIHVRQDRYVGSAHIALPIDGGIFEAIRFGGGLALNRVLFHLVGTTGYRVDGLGYRIGVQARFADNPLFVRSMDLYGSIDQVMGGRFRQSGGTIHYDDEPDDVRYGALYHVSERAPGQLQLRVSLDGPLQSTLQVLVRQRHWQQIPNTRFEDSLEGGLILQSPESAGLVWSAGLAWNGPETEAGSHPYFQDPERRTTFLLLGVGVPLGPVRVQLSVADSHLGAAKGRRQTLFQAGLSWQLPLG